MSRRTKKILDLAVKQQTKVNRRVTQPRAEFITGIETLDPEVEESASTSSRKGKRPSTSTSYELSETPDPEVEESLSTSSRKGKRPGAFTSYELSGMIIPEVEESSSTSSREGVTQKQTHRKNLFKEAKLQPPDLIHKHTITDESFRLIELEPMYESRDKNSTSSKPSSSDHQDNICSNDLDLVKDNVLSLKYLCKEIIKKNKAKNLVTPVTSLCTEPNVPPPNNNFTHITAEYKTPLKNSNEGLVKLGTSFSPEHRTPSPRRSFQHITAENSTSPLENNASLTDVDDDDDLVDPDYLENENNNSESETGSEGNKENKRRNRKRKVEKSMWKKNITKKMRHSGLQYKTDSGSRIMHPKTLKEPCVDTCKLKCKEKIPENTRQIIFKQYWSPSKTIDQKRQYIASQVEQKPIQRNRIRSGKRQGKRIFSNIYSFEVSGGKKVVCKTFFLNTLSISQQSVDTAIKKKKDGGIISPDRRGKHPPANKISEETRNSVRDHISKFPTYESHYSRERSKKMYLGSHLNLSRMFKMYEDACQEKKIPKEMMAKEWLYNEIFNYEFNFAFKNPDNDTCDICDEFTVKLREVTSLEERKEIQAKYDEHVKDADNRYKIKRQDKLRSRENMKKIKVVMIDLQKCLPTPDLQNSQSFYSLKLWTYNLTVYDSTIRECFCMMWDESVGGRGGNEVASCLIKWLYLNVPDDIEELVIWSDNCPSQNRNVLMVMCYFYMLILKPTLKVIHHKFLARGHTHHKADSCHSVIERERKHAKQFQVMTPWDWQQLARLAGTKTGFKVIEMEIQDFKDFKKLYEGQAPFVNKKKDSDGKDFLISHVVNFKVEKDSPGILYFKTTFDSNFSEVDFNKKAKRHVELCDNILRPIREIPKPISTKKFNHLQKLLKWVPKRFHNFYNALPHEENKDE